MLKQFKDKKKADTQLAAVRGSADQIDTLLAKVQLGDKVQTSWAKVKSEIGTISGEYGIQSQAATPSAK